MGRDGRLAEHRQQLPTLGTSLPGVGSHTKAPDEAPRHRSPHDGADDGLNPPRPFGNRPQATISR